MSGNGTVCGGGDDLTHCLGTHITGGENTGHRGASGFIGNDIALLIQSQQLPEQLCGRLAADAD